MLSAAAWLMLGSMLYALAFWRRPICFIRILLTKLVINLGVNVMLGALWSAFLYSKGYYYYLMRSLTKNLILWPIESVILFFFLRVILPQTNRMGLTVQSTVTWLPKRAPKTEEEEAGVEL